MKEVKVSIVTVCRNSEATIERCIQSVLSQTYKSIEHVIIDGKSTDKTCELIAKYKDSIGYFISESDNGIYSAWNKGIKRSSGEYIFILNSDDVFHDDKVVEDVVKQLLANNRPLVIYGKQLSIEDSGYFFIEGGPIELNKFIYKSAFSMCVTAFVNRDVYTKIGLFNENFKIASDLDWIVRLFKGCDNDQIVYYDRIIEDFSLGGVSNSNYRLTYKEVSQIIKKHFSKADYCKHLVFIELWKGLKWLIPYCEQLGVLSVWRKIKPKLFKQRYALEK